MSLPRKVANSYMLFLSESVSRRRLIPKVTDDADMFAAMAYFQQDGHFDEAVYKPDAAEITANLALASIVPNDIGTYPMRQIIQFHARSQDGRAAFRTAVSNLIYELKGIKDKKFFAKRLKEFDNDLRHSRLSMVSLLREGGADFAYCLITVGLPMTFSAFTFVGMTGDPWNFESVGESAMLGVMAALAEHAKGRRSTWTSREANYWLSLHSAFKSDGGVQLRLPHFHRRFEEFIND